MRSWTSRGVPEWSGGDDRYIGRRVLESESVPGVPGYGQHDRKVFREPRQVLGASWAKGRGKTSPLRGCAPPHRAQGAGKWGRGQTLGQMGPKAHPRCMGPRGDGAQPTRA